MKFLPRPLHGWRVFSGEVAVIVLGVLIALGAEQIVQAYDWRERVGRGRNELRSEIGQAVRNAEDRIELGPCSNKRLDLLDGLLMGTKASLDKPMIVTRYYTVIAPWSQAVWATMMSSGVVEHLPESEMLAYASLYESIALVREEMTAEQDSISDLALLTRLRGRLNDTTRTQLLLASSRARRLNSTIIRDSRQIVDGAQRLNIPAAKDSALAAFSPAYKGCPSLLGSIPGVPQ
jgi:hypothetical protein